MIPKINRYIDPLFDFSFKKILGSEPNKDLLISFLNEVFRGRKHIVNIEYGKNEHPGDIPGERGAIFDVLCTGDDGEHFLIEVQRGKQENFRKRALFYASRHINSHVPKGDMIKDWKYDFPEVYVVAILADFNLESNKSDQYLRRISFCDEETTEIFYEELGFIFIELRNFTKTQSELETDLDKWLFLLKNMSQLQEQPQNFDGPVFTKLFDVAAYSNLSKMEKEEYDRRQKYIWDNKNVADYELKIATQEAGYEKAIEIAQRMKQNNFSIQQIAELTELPIEEIERLS